ncbi:AAA family ATPase [Pseudomonas brassicacearum]|uniref:AAA family ATPase n=1 Tax=Pseudomonas brassicacearum TaxID=930166 RepID=UPI001BDE304E|nr:AAA family ATPase [Pseudomonas brassicacearum]
MNWQISRIEVSSFKAFKNVSLDLDNSSLFTLDGPNGFGKTSIFDAIELLLTGQIKRIDNLFTRLMNKKQVNYDDNLFWNIRSGEKDLTIKIEFVNQERTITLARHATAKSLKQKALNRADSFSQFLLYELPEFPSTDYAPDNLRKNEYIDELFGENFRENFSFLNYLEQGQNPLLFSKVESRKDALGNLFNTTDILTEIENCKAVQRRFTKYLSDTDRKTKESELIAEGESLRAMAQADLGSVEYKKLSTADQQAGWDKEDLFPTYSSEILDQYLDSTRRLQELLLLKSAVQIRFQNDRIDTYIEQNMESLRSVAQFGNDLNNLDTLESVKKELNLLAKAKAAIQRGTTAITLAEAQALPNWEPDRQKWFEEQITTRNSLSQQNQTNATIVAELARLKIQLLEEHAKIHPDDPNCPLCGADWQKHQAMLDAIQGRSQQIVSTLGADGKALVDLTTRMTEELVPIAVYIQSRETTLSNYYNEALHTALERARVRLTSIQQLAERIKTTGTPINYLFSVNAEIVEERLLELITSIRAKKSLETETLPEDWRQTIDTTFKAIEDFYILEQQDLATKIQYISIKANEARNTKLQKSLESLQKIQRENEAATLASQKVKRLRDTLERVERSYSDHTISEIELIFHIYSGRLIQNYQRGLGLFIESREGKQLRFLTAEKSDHDAVLSMSSGQVSALSLAFFLSLNKVYADVPLILIDDPAQSLDEVNVASLTDLLRCELKHRQLIVSSHEEDISAYMRYRFTKAGLSTRSLNMQRLAKEAS